MPSEHRRLATLFQFEAYPRPNRLLTRLNTSNATLLPTEAPPMPGRQHQLARLRLL